MKSTSLRGKSSNWALGLMTWRLLAAGPVMSVALSSDVRAGRFVSRLIGLEVLKAAP